MRSRRDRRKSRNSALPGCAMPPTLCPTGPRSKNPEGPCQTPGRSGPVRHGRDTPWRWLAQRNASNQGVSMKHRILGGTGIWVSEFALGTMMFGAMGNPDHDESIRMIHTALDGGINFVDTADVYSRGESEVILGKALKGRRDEVVLATKFSLPMGEDPNQRGGSPRWIKRAVQDSLRRLDTDYLDLYPM